MNLKQTLIVLPLIFACLCSCKNKSAQFVGASETEILNNQGFVFFNEYLYSNGDYSLLDSALLYFDKAMAVDKNNEVARQNKIAVLYEQKKYDEIIANLYELIEKTEPCDYQTNAMLYRSLAYPYHLKGDSIMEQSILLKAQQCYQLGLKEPLDESFVLDYLLFVVNTEGKDSALLELEKHEEAFQDFIQYEEVKEHLLLGDFDYRDSH